MAELLPSWLVPANLTPFSNPGPAQRATPRRGGDIGPSSTSSSSPSSSSASAQAPHEQAYTSRIVLEHDGEAPRDRLPAHYINLPLLAFGLGFGTGFYTGSKKAGLVFMAENAHRQPTTVQGWYFYNKTKNYRVLLAGAKGGAKQGLKLTAWVSAFLALDEAFCLVRTGTSSYAANLREERERQRLKRRAARGERELRGPWAKRQQARADAAGQGATDSALAAPSVSASAAFAQEQQQDDELEETLQERALNAMQTSLDSIRGLITGGLSGINTTPPVIDLDLPAQTYSSRADVAQYEEVQQRQRQQQQEDFPQRTYEPHKDVQQLEALYGRGDGAAGISPAAAAALGAGDVAVRPSPPWWSERAWEERQVRGGMWLDGFCAGGVTALGALAIYRIRGPQALRTVSLGTLAGGSMGLLRDAQAWLKAKESSAEA